MANENKKFRVLNTELLKEISYNSAEKDFNRLLPASVHNKLDPDGYHIVSFSMVHGHRQGVRVDDHIRCVILVKREFLNDPLEVVLDMTMEDFDRIPQVESGETQEYYKDAYVRGTK